MKNTKIICLIAWSFLTTDLSAQTNTFPSSGSVGIGTTSPIYTLDVNGSFHVSGTGLFGSSITATSFSGAGTGLTGTASGLTAGNSNLLGGYAVASAVSPNTIMLRDANDYSYIGTAAWDGSTPGQILMNYNNTGKVVSLNPSQLQSWLGLGSNAFTNTTYLPLTGGTLTGNLSGVNSSFSGTGQFNDWIGSNGIPNNGWGTAYKGITLSSGIGYIAASSNSTGYSGTGYGQSEWGQNSYYNGTNSIAIGTGAASQILQGTGQIHFYIAPSIISGSTQTFTDIVQITSNGLAATQFNGSGAGLTGIASGLSIGGTASGETLQTVTSRNATTTTGANFEGTINASTFQSTSQGTGGMGASFLAEGSATPGFGWYNTVSGTDSKVWDAFVAGYYLLFRAVNDANTAATNWMQVNRSGLTINSVSFPNGNIGIGTTSPQSLLSVNGTITGKQVNVTQTGWSDFVFNKGYKLKPLSLVANYITQNNHLPGISSAEEIESKGLNLGDMEKKQMQKIEELTLYAIDQDKQLRAQQQTIKELKKIVNDQNERLTTLEKKMDK